MMLERLDPSIQKVQRIPSEPRQFTLFASLIDGDGEITLEVAINRLESGEEIYKRSRRLNFGNRLQEVRFIFHVTECSFPVEGAYEVVPRANAQLLALRKIKVVRKEKEK